MSVELDVAQYGMIASLGVVAGIINMMAGGGSNLILPLLMLLGIDPQTANGTNRVGIWFQSISGISAYHRHKRLPTEDLLSIVLPTMIGGLCGALLAAKINIILALFSDTGIAKTALIKATLLGTMLAMATIIFFRPQAIISTEVPVRVGERPIAAFWLWLGGVYGGFVMAGVGFVLITVFSGVLRYDLVRANALKVLCTLGFTSVALAIFIWQGQVLWLAGILLAVGNATGAYIGVKFAIRTSQKILRWLLFVMTIAAIIAALLF